MAKNQKLIFGLLLLGALVSVIVGGCFVANQSLRFRQFSDSNAWASANPSVKDAYDPQGGWTGSGKGPKLMNLHTDMQTFEKGVGVSNQPAPAGFRPNRGLLSQPFSSAFEHTSVSGADPLPDDNEINDSPFAVSPDGTLPWKEGYKSSTTWAGSHSKPTDMFATYNDPFSYNKSSGLISSVAIEKEREYDETGGLVNSIKEGLQVNVEANEQGVMPFESQFHQRMVY